MLGPFFNPFLLELVQSNNIEDPCVNVVYFLPLCKSTHRMELRNCQICSVPRHSSTYHIKETIRTLCYLYRLFFFSFYHLSFVTLSTYFIASHIPTWDFTSYMQCFSFFFNTWRSKRRRILSLQFLSQNVFRRNY